MSGLFAARGARNLSSSRTLVAIKRQCGYVAGGDRNAVMRCRDDLAVLECGRFEFGNFRASIRPAPFAPRYPRPAQTPEPIANRPEYGPNYQAPALGNCGYRLASFGVVVDPWGLLLVGKQSGVPGGFRAFPEIIDTRR
jgi:hypothetical protein